MSQTLQLKRELSVWAAASIVVGTVIGSGIFITPRSMVLNVGHPQTVVLVFIFGGILSLLGALTYAELGAAMPEAGGEYVYLREAYGPFWGFLYGWTQMFVAKSGSIATLATGFFAYAASFSPALESVWLTVPLSIGPNWQPLAIRYGQIFAIGVIIFLGALNYFGVKFGGQVQLILTLLKVVIMAGIIVLGLSSPLASAGHFATFIPAAKAPFAGFFAALVASLWAYDGWNNVSMVASEVKDPQRSLPRSLILGVLGVMAIYVAMTVAYFLVLSASDVASGDRVAVVMMQKMFGTAGGTFVSIAVMISIFAALNGSILSGARVPFAMSRDGLFFHAIGDIHPTYRTPGKSIVALTIWASLLVLSGRYEELFNFVIFGSWILYALAAASVFVFRHRRPDMPRPYRTLGYPVVPALFVIVAIVLLISTLLDKPRESLFGLVLMAAGLPFYWYWRRRQGAISIRNTQ